MANFQSAGKKTTNKNMNMTTTTTRTGRILPSEEQIRTRAYYLWQAHGCQNGTDRNDWYEAEQQLITENLRK
jgi:hypothetical protein